MTPLERGTGTLSQAVDGSFMVEWKSTLASAVLIAVLFGVFWQLWQTLGVTDSTVVNLLVPFVLALAAAFGVSVVYYAVRARMRTR